MKFLFLIALLFLFYSCQSPTEKLKAKIIPVLKDGIMSDDKSIAKIDSINIYKVDTLNDFKYLSIREANLLKKSGYYRDVVSEDSKELKSNFNDLKTSKSDIEVANEYNSEALRQSAQSNYDRANQKIADINVEAKKYIDSMNTAYNEALSIDKRRNEKKLNNKNFRGYEVLFKILGVDKNNIEIKKDSLTIIISPNFRIIRYGSI